MAEPQSGMVLTPPMKSTPDKWEQVKRVFLNLHQDQVAQADMTLTETLRRSLAADPLLGKGDVAHMHSAVKGAVVTLTGHVGQADHKARAEAIARETPGVATVVNHLVVDKELMIVVAQALSHGPQTANEQLQVNVQHGVVYLGGAVNRAAVRTSAAQVAAGIPQVRGIINVIQTPGSVVDADEERFVQPLVASAIYATDGQVGHVQQVVIDPQTRRVTAVVVHAQLGVPQDLDWTHLPDERLQPQHAILIPIHSIRCAPSGALFLNVNSGEAAHFADFNPRSFDRPTADWQPPYPYVSADVLCSGYRAGKESR